MIKYCGNITLFIPGTLFTLARCTAPLHPVRADFQLKIQPPPSSQSECSCALGFCRAGSASEEDRKRASESPFSNSQA